MRLPETADVMGTAFFVESGSEVYGLSRIANVAVTVSNVALSCLARFGYDQTSLAEGRV